MSQLDSSWKALAKKEVGEDSKVVAAHLESFKRWLASCPHLKIPANDLFLLSFLRYAHYNHAEAQRRIDNYCTLRCSDELTSKWYNYPKLDDPIIEKYFNAGVFIPLGFTQSGMYVILLRIATWSAVDIEPLQMRAMNNMIYERLIADERCQIGGTCLFIDAGEMTMEHVKKMGDFQEHKAALRLMQEASPGRTKFIVFYNESKTFDAVFRVMQVWISEKMKKRILRVGLDIRKVGKKIKGIEDVLPIEYGGRNGTMEEAIKRSRTEFMDFFAKGYPLEDLAVDESKRPNSTKNYLAEYTDVMAGFTLTTGTYIEIDPYA